MTLKSFPRGGKKPIAKPHVGLSFNKKNASTKPKKRRGKKSSEVEPLEEEKSYVADTAECLTYSSLGEGMVLLGRIHETTEYDMIVSLPGRLSGRIQVTDLSQSYTNLLRNIVNSEDGKINEFKSLLELYKRGKYVVCCVKSVTPAEKWRVSLSLEPELINRNLDPAKLRKGSKIVGTVSSVEDHGYVIDTGLDNFRSFLALKDIDEGVEYYPGKQLFCAVKSVKVLENSTTAQLTTKSKHVTTVMSDDEQTLDAQIPGTKHLLTVQRILKNGLQVSFNNGNVGYVNRIYLDNALETYECGNVLHGVLMYVMPTLKFAYFTLLPSDEGKERLNVGDTFEHARVSYIGPKGVIMMLKKGIRGFVPFRRTDVAYEKIALRFATDTTHKCRVLAYDLFEQIYVCTMEHDLLEEKHFATSRLEPGERLSVEVTKIQAETGYLMVTAGRTKGWVPPEHVRDPEIAKSKQFKVGDTVDARVLGRDKKEKSVLFTLKKSLVESTLPILHDIADAKVGAKHHGTIVQITGNGLLVRFYGHVKGWVPARSLDPKAASVRWNYILGQVIQVKILDVKRDSEKMTLAVCTEKDAVRAEADFEIGENVEGVVVESSVEGVYLRITKNPGDTPKTAFLPAGHVSPCEEVGTFLAARYTSGQTLSALVFSTKPQFLLTRTFVSREECRNLKTLKVGDCLPCSIHEINENGLKLVLPIKNFDAYGHASRLDVETLRPYQTLFGRVTSINHKARKVHLATTLHGVWPIDGNDHENDLMASVDVLTLHFAKLRELADHDYYKNKPISRMKIGERVKGVVDKITNHGLVLKLENEAIATVRNDHHKGALKVGDAVNGTILWINYVHELVEVTLLPKIVNTISTKQQKLSKIPINTPLRADIVLVTSWFVLVVLKGAASGLLAALPARRHLNDVKPDLTPYGFGKRLRCYLVLNQSETELLPICLVKSSFEVGRAVESPVKNDLKRKTTQIQEDATPKKKTKLESTSYVEETLVKKKKLKKEKEDTKSKLPMSSVGEHTAENPAKKKKLKKETPKLRSNENAPEKNERAEKSATKKTMEQKLCEKSVETKADNLMRMESPDSAYSESDDDNDGDATEKSVGLPECGFFWDSRPDEALVAKEESSSDDEVEDEDEARNQKRKKKKMSAAERREAERQKEREIRAREEALASNEAPNSVDQFDRLVLSSPDSSMIWLQYMAYHLQATEIEKARAVAKRAIKTINFREENERLNVWQAWLNLESRFGSPESLNGVFQEAAQTNDARSIYLHMLTVHADAGRQAELEKIVTAILGKFKQFPDVWYECGAAFLKMGLKEKSRHVMQRALQSLPPQEHVNLMVKFAHLENKYGDKERAHTLFEQVLSSYPKRVDVWSSYVDALVKSENYDGARKVLEKAVVQTLPARKMKTLFKKFIDFEQKHGTPEGVAHVQELALKYVENECNTDPV